MAMRPAIWLTAAVVAFGLPVAGPAATPSAVTANGPSAIPGATLYPRGFEVRHNARLKGQLVLATLAGIGRAAAEDVARLVAERTRVYSHGNAGRTADDPQVQAVVGRVRGNAYAAGAVVLKAAEALQRAHDAHLGRDPAAADRATALADVEVNQAVTVVTNLVLEATTGLFDALGASAVKEGLGLDRYWRNARTIASHNPRIYRDRIVGAFAVNGAAPPRQYRVGAA